MKTRPIYALQLANALQRLPRPSDVNGEFFKIPIYPRMISGPSDDFDPDQNIAVLIFKKSKRYRDWVLVEMPNLTNEG